MPVEIIHVVDRLFDSRHGVESKAHGDRSARTLCDCGERIERRIDPARPIRRRLIIDEPPRPGRRVERLLQSGFDRFPVTALGDSVEFEALQQGPIAAGKIVAALDAPAASFF